MALYCTPAKKSHCWAYEHLQHYTLLREWNKSTHWVRKMTQRRLSKTNSPKVFTGLGRLEGNYQIRLKEDAVPYALTNPRRVPIPLTEKVKEELKRMEDMVFISKIEKPTEWCAGIVVVPKPNGKIRLC